MAEGKLYVVFNKWIRNPDTNEMPYKIGITKNSVKQRYYGLEIKMPGEFETLFVYKFSDSAIAENTIHNILKEYHINGEWFNIKENIFEHIKKTCEIMGGKLLTRDELDKEDYDEELINENEDIDYEDENEEDILGDDFITVNEINIPLHRGQYENTQDFIKRLLRLLYNNNLIPDNEIARMLDRDYCRETFKYNFQ